MKKRIIHTNDVTPCPRCEKMLLSAHPDIIKWFTEIKAKWPNCHISCAYRGAEEQNKAVAEGKSKLKFPNSPHNFMLPDGTPASKALDLFVLSEEGEASFPIKFYTMIWQYCKQQQMNIIWGGNFKSLGDANHFQLL